MEGKVNWHYTCRVCGEIVQYGFAAGPAIGTCNKCKDILKDVMSKPSIPYIPLSKWCDTCKDRLSCVFYIAGEKCTRKK